ncbi:MULTISPECIES: MalY/PatB family protein [Providencia]|uniref:MalY/PatB family protein n=1 Tax=Providencia TaxID=586 RepID=UPI001B9A6C27|nr:MULTISPECIES: PatB family C-S lyase [Providencia]WOB80584.1 PatB family C-S lyase [Providencia sp. PROV114]HBC7430089.1 PatB family C-S lyase [Providencia rettgeri]
MKYNFDEIIDRKDTDSLNYDGWRQYIFKDDKNAKYNFDDDEFIRMWVADMDFSTPPEILNSLKERLDRKILGYTKIYNDEYYQIFESWCKRKYQWEIDRNEIVISPGIIPALNRIIPLIIDSNEKILIHTPSYAPFKNAGDYNSREVIYSNLKHVNGKYEIDFVDFEKKITNADLNIRLFILSNPQNPTGHIWTEEELISIGKICFDNNVWIISDEIHCDLLRKGKKHIPLAKLFPNEDKIITCMAPSKTFNLAGNLMSNLLIKSEKVRHEWLKLYDDFISPLSIIATKSAYKDCDDWLEQLKEYLDDNFKLTHEFFTENFPKCNFIIPDSTYLAWIDINEYLPSYFNKDKLSLFFANKSGVLLEGGNMFVGNGDGFIRLNLACPREILIEGLNRIKTSLLSLY